MAQNTFGLDKDEKPAATASAELEVEELGKFTIGLVATIGRSPESQVTLKLPSVSRHHARIFYEGGHYWIKDLDSANGISINGKAAKFQMLADQDRICFGDAKSIFRTSIGAGGPAPIGQDPFAGNDSPIPDGTPTSGLEAVIPVRGGMRPGTPPDGMPRGMTIAAEEEIRALKKQVESLQKENDSLQLELRQLRMTRTGAPLPASPSADQVEVERLQKLVGRLERALADSNQRIRNLQQKFEGIS